MKRITSGCAVLLTLMMSMAMLGLYSPVALAQATLRLEDALHRE